MADLPQHLLVGAHPRQIWLDAGLTRRELDSRLMRSVHHGRYSWAATDASRPRQRALTAASVLPRQGLDAVAGWSAAALLGVQWLDGTTPAGQLIEPVLALQPGHRVRRAGVTVLRSPLDRGDVVRVQGLPGVRVTSPVRTAFDLARTASSLTEAVVALDAMARHGVDPRLVAAYAERRPGWKSVGRARQGAALASSRVRSPAESRWRMLWVADAGLPAPLVNAVILGQRGERIAEVDLLDPDRGLVGEYDGSPHSDAGARAYDSLRQERLEGAGLVVVRATSVDLGRHRFRTVARLQDAARRAQPSSSGQWRVRLGRIPCLPLTAHTEWSELPRHAGVSVSK